MKCKPVVTAAEAKEMSPRARKLFEGEKICKFRMARKFKAARFENKKDKSEFAIVHPSTKKKGYCQISFFDAEGPWSDRQHKTCAAAVADLSPRQWRLKSVK